MANRNCFCALSVIKKQCPKRQFECHRCAAKLQNSETLWELTIPIYESWLYNAFDSGVSIGSTPFTANSAGDIPAVFYSTYQKIPKNSDGSLQNCNFEATNDLDFTVPSTSTAASSANWPYWVADYDISRITNMSHTAPYYYVDFNLGIPFYLPGKFSPGVPSWNLFSMDHDALIHFLEPVVENGNVTTPGEWRIDLTLTQQAYYGDVTEVGDSYVFGTLAEMNAFISGLSPLEVFWADEPTLSVSISNGAVSTAAIGSGTFEGVYQAPENFTCPIETGETYRFTNIIPYDLPPLKVATVSPVIPDGYGEPKSNIVYPLKPERDASFEGESFEEEDYYAPPYIDVRHVRRSDLDVN